MLSRDTHNQQAASPFTFEGLGHPVHPVQQQTQPQPQAAKERNRGRGFRRAGNACEIAAGAALNSAIVFTFHMMQVHPVGLFLALGVSHFYLTATVAGEGQDKLVANVMTASSSALAGLTSLSEPIGEWVEASRSRSTATSEIQEIYSPQQPTMFSNEWVMFGAIVGIAALLIMGSRK